MNHQQSPSFPRSSSDQKNQINNQPPPTLTDPPPPNISASIPPPTSSPQSSFKPVSNPSTKSSSQPVSKPPAPPSSPQSFSSPPPPSSLPPHPPKPASLPLKPAQLPHPDTKTPPIIATSLGILALLAIAAATTLFLRNQKLQQPLKPPSSKNPPTTNTVITSKPTPIHFPQTTPQLTPKTTPVSPLTTFSQLTKIIQQAKNKTSSAQLLMITANNILKPHQFTTKYWFRQTDNAGNKNYFYILSQPNAPLKLVDQQIYVTPDNNIPSLNQSATAKLLGIDLDQTLTIAQETVINHANLKSDPNSISAQFIQTQTNKLTPLNLWQLTYSYLDRAAPVIIQVNSQTQEVIYTNINYTQPSPAP